MINRQMTPFFSSTLWALSINIFYFCISIPSNFSSIGSPFPYVLVCKIHIYMVKMILSSLLTQIPFFYRKVVNFWYKQCFVPSMILIWPWSHGLKHGLSRERRTFFDLNLLTFIKAKPQERLKFLNVCDDIDFMCRCLINKMEQELKNLYSKFIRSKKCCTYFTAFKQCSSE